MKNIAGVVALEHRLSGCKNVVTFGVKPNFLDYSEDEQRTIREAPKIYYPSTFYADLFDVYGKPTFPSYHTYKCVQDKIKQTALFSLLGIPHPRTRVYYARKNRVDRVEKLFKYPFIAKEPRGSAMGRGVYLIHNREEFATYDQDRSIAYIQEYLPVDRDIRVVVIGSRAVHAYWRLAPENDFRTNIAVGGRVSLDGVPDEAIRLALHASEKCGWDDVGIDICCHADRYYILEANMKYGKEGFRKAGIDYTALMETLIENGEI
ncbi:MAG: ATP-grasp domain-containing protein [Desulfobacteraceae bacterium]|nr:ATP-grasp domain-containing protein [Desulfobacteraceae bacterium]